MFDTQTYVARRNALREKVQHGLVVLPGNNESPMNYAANGYRFRQDSNFRYFFGIDRAGFVGVMDVEEGTDCLYADNCDMDDIIWMGPQPTVQQLGEQVGVRRTFALSELQKTIQRAIRYGRKIHFLPPYREENRQMLSNLIGIKSGSLVNYVSELLIRSVVALREIKSAAEIDEIDKACDIGYLMHTEAMRLCRPGIYEREVAGAIEGVATIYGNGVSFPSIVSQNGETLHNHYHGNKLAAGRLLLIDAGVESATGYSSDFTRTIPVDGRFTSGQKAVYELVLEVNNRSTAMIKKGVTYRSVHLASAKILAAGLKELGLMKGEVDDIVANGAQALFMPHGLGHQMGLDVHDMEDLGERFVGYDQEVERSTQFGLGSLRMGRKLCAGHVLTVEPGVYFIPELIAKWKREKINDSFINYPAVEKYIGFGGIRIEDDVVVTADGCRRLGKQRVPVTVAEVEAAMGK
ncbi:MAG: aminopeptidase P family protein [Rikenellaceae bacterium]|jgi:Xaa-Pro aminopeptidase|nr:aminopeptidase P family protein [Rikenellaceae bacterium]